MWRLYFTSNTGYLGIPFEEIIDLGVTECNEQARKKAAKKALDYLLKERKERTGGPTDYFRDFVLRYVAAGDYNKTAFIEELRALLK